MFTVSDYVVSEVATVLRANEGVQIATRAVSPLSWNSKVEVLRLTEEEFEATTHFFLREKKPISFVDASLVILATKRRCKLVTFDTDLAKVVYKP